MAPISDAFVVSTCAPRSPLEGRKRVREEEDMEGSSLSEIVVAIVEPFAFPFPVPFSFSLPSHDATETEVRMATHVGEAEMDTREEKKMRSDSGSDAVVAFVEMAVGSGAAVEGLIVEIKSMKRGRSCDEESLTEGESREPLESSMGPAVCDNKCPSPVPLPQSESETADGDVKTTRTAATSSAKTPDAKRTRASSRHAPPPPVDESDMPMIPSHNSSPAPTSAAETRREGGRRLKASAPTQIIDLVSPKSTTTATPKGKAPRGRAAAPMSSAKKAAPPAKESKPRRGKAARKACPVEQEEEEDDVFEEALALLCDGCDGEHFLDELGLAAVPDGDWFCPPCVLKRSKVESAGGGRGRRQGATKFSSASTVIDAVADNSSSARRSARRR